MKMEKKLNFFFRSTEKKYQPTLKTYNENLQD